MSLLQTDLFFVNLNHIPMNSKQQWFDECYKIILLLGNFWWWDEMILMCPPPPECFSTSNYGRELANYLMERGYSKISNKFRPSIKKDCQGRLIYMWGRKECFVG